VSVYIPYILVYVYTVLYTFVLSVCIFHVCVYHVSVYIICLCIICVLHILCVIFESCVYDSPVSFPMNPTDTKKPTNTHIFTRTYVYLYTYIDVYTYIYTLTLLPWLIHMKATPKIIPVRRVCLPAFIWVIAQKLAFTWVRVTWLIWRRQKKNPNLIHRPIFFNTSNCKSIQDPIPRNVTNNEFVPPEFVPPEFVPPENSEGKSIYYEKL